jgi:uncharacterized membrane protein
VILPKASLVRLRSGIIFGFIFLVLMVIFGHWSISRAALTGVLGVVCILAVMVVGQFISMQLEKRG